MCNSILHFDVSSEKAKNIFKNFYEMFSKKFLFDKFYFVEKLGPRISYLCGFRNDALPINFKLKVNNKYEIYFCMEKIKNDEKNYIIEMILTELENFIKTMQ